MKNPVVPASFNMDIVRVALFNVHGKPRRGNPFMEEVAEEVRKLIKSGDYPEETWPKEWGSVTEPVTTPQRNGAPCL